MNIKEYKKEQSEKTPYQKISQKLTAVNHEIQRPHNVHQKLKGLKEHKARGEALKNRVEHDVHEEKEGRGYGRRASY